MDDEPLSTALVTLVVPTTSAGRGTGNQRPAGAGAPVLELARL